MTYVAHQKEFLNRRSAPNASAHLWGKAASTFFANSRKVSSKQAPQRHALRAVQDHITVWANFREGLAHLLDDPLRTRMSSDRRRM